MLEILVLGDLRNTKYFHNMNQLKALQEIYRTANISPVFRPNPLFASRLAEDEIPYISLGDVLENRYIIRLIKEGDMTGYPILTNGPMLVKYDTLEHLAGDGWQLD
ncbi:MAG: hypothetical protein IJR53_04345 [Bacteroidales bacterium]|nr:hypothetical protein [Bacteroidales bacterium]